MQKRPSRNTLLAAIYWLSGISLAIGVALWLVRLRQQQSASQPMPQPYRAPAITSTQPNTVSQAIHASPDAPVNTSSQNGDSTVLEDHDEVVASINEVMTHPHQNTTMATALATAVEAPTNTEVETATQPATQQVVGNIRTLVYHLATSKHLPAEDNRRYFDNATEAEIAGYRPSEV